MLSIEAIHKSNLKFALTAFGAWTLGIFFLTWPLRDIISPTQRQAWIIAIPAALVCVASLVVAFAGLRHSRSHAYKLQEHLEVLKCLEATLDERIRDFELQDKISTAATDTIPAHDSSPNAP